MKHSKPTCHVVAMPYAGRGHINPMLNLCKHMLIHNPNILFTFIVTEEWKSLLSSYKTPPNICFQTIPNVIPSEHVRANDFPAFIEAVATKLEAPFERVLDEIEVGVDVILYDTYLGWVVNVGNRRNIPVASLWTMSATVFSFFHHFQLVGQNGHFPADLSERGEEVVDYIPGFPPTRLLDLPTVFGRTGMKTLNRALESVSMVSKAQYLLFTSVNELEASVIDALKLAFPFPVYPVGPSIPYMELEDNSNPITNDHNVPEYLEWLNLQPENSVLYISMGSYLSISSSHVEELVAGICESGVRFLMVSRGKTNLLKDGHGSMGLVVPWCDQLRVLCHPSVGGFWSHCGWNSALEAVFSGVPMLTCPIFWDQTTNSKNIVEDWNIGWSIKRGVDCESFMKHAEIAELLRSFMDPESGELKTMRKRARELQEACQAAIASGGSSHANLDSFIKNISQRESK